MNPQPSAEKDAPRITAVVVHVTCDRCALDDEFEFTPEEIKAGAEISTPCACDRRLAVTADASAMWTSVTSPAEYDGCICRDPLREVHAGCPLHGHSPERVLPPAEHEHEWAERGGGPGDRWQECWTCGQTCEIPPGGSDA